MSIEQQAAQNFIERAMHSTEYHTAELLLNSAHRLDSTLDINRLKSVWLENWLKDNQNRSVK